LVWLDALQESKKEQLPKVDAKIKLDFGELERSLQPELEKRSALCNLVR
jgi:hypothetical protein